MAESKTEVQVPPEGVEPAMMSMKMMETYDVKTGPGLKDVVPFKYFKKEFVMKEIIDMGFYSAFNPFRKQLEKYPLDEILVIADLEEVYGENWLVCVTEAAFNSQKEIIEEETRKEAEAKRKAEEEAEAARKALEEEENRVYEDLPLIPGPYASETVDATSAEVALLTPRPSRPRVKVKITRRRAEFGARYVFNDKEVDGAVAEFRGRRAPEYTLSRSVMDVALQDTPGCMSGLEEVSTQTSWSRKINTAVQCQPEDGPGTAAAGASSSTTASTATSTADVGVGGGGATTEDVPEDKLQAFLQAVLPVCEHALQQNETLNIFEDELSLLDEEEAVVVGTKGENSMRTLINFMDLAYSNNKSLVSLDWHPTNRTWLAASAVQDLTFDSRVHKSGRALRSFVLVYTFSEFSAQIVLESPQDIFCFRWNPWDANIIAAGCSTGQVLLFDLNDAMNTLTRKQAKSSKSGGGGGGAGAGAGGGGGSSSEGKSDKSIRVKHKYMSTIDHSHTKPVTQIIWLPPTHHLSSRQKFVPSEDGKSYQFLSGAPDGHVLAWDTQFVEKTGKTQRMPTGGGGGGGAGGSGAAAEVPWQPTYRCLLRHGQGKCGISRMALNLECPSDPLYCTTEDGTFVVADWAPPGQGTGFEKAGVAPPAATEDTGEEAVENTGSFRVLWATPDHQRPTKALQRSPFFENLLLSVGDWEFTLWRDGMKQPLFRSPSSAVPITCGRWSPTRPSVVFIGKSDGTLDIWDLVDQTHKPAMAKAVVSLPITCMEFRDAGAGRQQLLACGDAKGTLHIIDVPLSLRKASALDHSLMSAHLDREFSRVEYFENRRAIRAEELLKKEARAEAAEREQAAADAARETEIAAATALLAEGEELDLEELERQKQAKKAEEEETQYMALERSIMTDLGLDPDTYVVEDEPAGAGDTRRPSTAALDGVKVEFAASAGAGAAAVL